ncbi:hypothetical protein GDO86_014037 [Hymenochirus boettgeri]|uniref:Uncharacterized protein n=1 Tax=Hymenochirus boettgeri TaxID=247094 RepID=A0A8T2JSN7_9PIPI|nr:hypothetical protein GDO86_014037 [Hymenochirus boettgeri]
MRRGANAKTIISLKDRSLILHRRNLKSSGPDLNADD